MRYKVFITGAAGFLGSHIVNSLSSEKVDLKILIHKSNLPKFINHTKIEIIRGDIREINLYENEFKNYDFIIHNANLTDPTHSNFKLNTEIDSKIFLSAIRMQVKNFIYTSSRATFGIDKKNIFNSSEVSKNFNNLKSIDYYTKSKLYSEKKMKEIFSDKEIKSFIICPTALLGPNDYMPTPIGKLFRNLINNKIKFYINGYLNIIDVRAAADFYKNIIIKNYLPGKYGLGAHNVSFKDLINLIKKNKKEFQYPFQIPKIFLTIIKLILKIFSFLFTKYHFLRPEKITRLQRGYSCFKSVKIENKRDFKDIDINDTIKDIINE